jgi:hypothetical protein
MTPNDTTVPSTTGVELAVHDLGGNGPLLLVSHATGFHGYCYLPIADRLSEEFTTLLRISLLFH